MFEMRGDSLYVGADDSNHAGDSKGEIIVATFSCLEEDSVIRNYRNYRDYSASYEEWFSSPNRDYRFGILLTEKYRHSHANLVYIVPELVIAFLDENDLRIKSLKIYLDGRLDKGGRNSIRDRFRGVHGIESVVADNFIKKHPTPEGKISKHPRCPATVYYADLRAHDLNSKSFQELSHHEKLVLTR